MWRNRQQKQNRTTEAAWMMIGAILLWQWGVSSNDYSFSWWLIFLYYLNKLQYFNWDVFFFFFFFKCVLLPHTSTLFIYRYLRTLEGWDAVLQKRLAWALFVLCYQPSCVVSQQSWFGLFCFINVPILLPPPPVRRGSGAHSNELPWIFSSEEIRGLMEEEIWIHRASLRLKKTEFLDKSSINIDILSVFFDQVNP